MKVVLGRLRNPPIAQSGSNSVNKSTTWRAKFRSFKGEPYDRLGTFESIQRIRTEVRELRQGSRVG